MHCRDRHKEGSAIVESCLVMAILCLILFSILQVSYIIAARNVINYSAVATARAASVGLNDFMLHKVSRYVCIPAAGPFEDSKGLERVRPGGASTGAQFDNAISRKNTPRSALGEYEVGVRQAYHLAGVEEHQQILDYENWQRSETEVHFEVEEDSRFDMLHVTVEQNVPLVFPFSRAFFSHLQTVRAERGRGDVATYPAKWIEAKATIEDHSKLYLGNRD